MSKKILIVESDTELSASLRQALEGRGFSVDETTDGKGSVEQIRRERPDLVVLAVDLSAGQNGYLLCGKLKKDDELKEIPIIIIGNPDGFTQHRKLKAHADDYVAKPVDAAALVQSAGALIGFPSAHEEVVEEGLALEGLDEPMGGLDEPLGAEEIAVAGDDGTVQGDPELDMLDAAFESDPADIAAAAAEEPVEAPPESALVEDGFDGSDPLADSDSDEHVSALDSLDQELEQKTVVGFIPPPGEDTEPGLRAPVMPSSARTPPPPRAGDAGELRSLRARVAELESALDDARSQQSSAESRVQELEQQLELKTTELETARATGGRSDRDTFALRDAANRKDKEILRLKSELNEKDQELVELREKEMQLEQQASEVSGEIARRDAQIKTLTAKTEQLVAERKKVDQQLAAAKEEARGATAKLAALQAELEAAQGSQDAVDDARRRSEELERETEALRKQLAELEDATARHEDRVTKLYARIKGDEKLREKTKKALEIALQLLADRPPSADADEEAAA